MIPKIERYNYYKYKDFRNGSNPMNLVQLVAHSNSYCEDQELTSEELIEIEYNRNLCVLFYEDAWSSRNGMILFVKEEFTNMDDAISYYETLHTHSMRSVLFPIADKILHCLDFIKTKYPEIENIPLTEEGFETLDLLERDIQSYIYQYDAMDILGETIASRPNMFCRSENGTRLQTNYSGSLSHHDSNGIIRVDYQLKEGEISGECIFYNHNGEIQEVAIYDGANRVESLKRWYPNGQIEYEKNDNAIRYWYKMVN